jgi:phosphate transport system permease protein
MTVSNSVFPETQSEARFDPKLESRYTIDNIFKYATWFATILALAVLAILLLDVLVDGLPNLSLDFLTSFPSRRPENSGVLSPLMGTLQLLIVTALFAFPIGVGAGIYLQEFAKDNWFTRALEINISNLAAVPTVIYGLLGLAAFVNLFGFLTGGRSIVSGGLTLALLILPVIIVATRESLKAIPDSLRLAGMALGSTRWQVVWEHVLPQAFAGILTGTILGLSRAIGDTATLVIVGAKTFVPFIPLFFQAGFTALPIIIFNWVSRPQPAFHSIAATGIIVLMIVLLTMNATAIFLRNKFQRSV